MFKNIGTKNMLSHEQLDFKFAYNKDKNCPLFNFGSLGNYLSKDNGTCGFDG